MRTLRLLSIMMLAAAALLVARPLAAQNSTVRVLFFTGNVQLNGSARPSIGQQLGPRDELTLASGATLQLSVNGKVLKYAQAAKVRVADAIKRAGKGENAAVATTVRTLAAASSNKGSRSSQAGATRVDGERSDRADSLEADAAREATERADREIRDRTGIENPTGTLGELAARANSNARTVILQPRSSAVSSGLIVFRWLRTPGVERYRVEVKDHVGDVVWSTEVSDTITMWNGSALAPEAVYSWELSAVGDGGRSEATFHRLSDADSKALNQGVATIRHELGDDNPALPVVLGAYFADNNCLGEAALFYTSAASRSQEHAEDFMNRAIEIYSAGMHMSREDLDAVAGKW